MPSIIKVDQIQSDTGTVNVSSNIAFTKPFNTTVGVGVQPSAWQSIYRGVEMGLPGHGIFARTDTQSLNLFTNCYRDSAGTYRYSGSNSAHRVQFDPSKIFTFWAGSGSAEGSISFVEGPNLVSGGIEFPASQISNGGPNVLDDYEEGNWTPAITRASVSPSLTTTTSGRYLKIGKKVTVWGTITISAVSSQGTNLWIIAGLPFSLTSGQRGTMGAAGNFSATSISASTNITAVGDAVVDNYLYCRNADGSTTNANFQAGTLYFTITYETPS